MRPIDRTARFHSFALGAAVLLTLLGGALPAAAAAEPAAQNTDRVAAESKLGEVLAEIGQLKARLEASRTEHRREQQGLRELDLQLQRVNVELRGLRQQESAQQDELEALRRQREEFLAQLEQRMDQLGEQLRLSYRTSRQSRIKLILNQDDPAQLGTMLAYYQYYARAQTGRISLLQSTLEDLEEMQRSIDLSLSQLAQLRTEQQAVLEELGRQRAQRQVLLAGLARQIGDEAARLKELERNRQDLEALLERLTDVLADIPPDLGERVGVEKQKGRLPMPLKGPVRHPYGQGRSGGLSWQGWLIGAEAGAEVRAIAYGRVAFADWLRGYGLLIIIDHGQGYMSLYGHNESLLHEAGAWVEPGDAISIVGSNPGNGQGLYFELRKSGRAIDPAAWLAR
ncbi:MAG TPA: peptidoglycan DD-metalloendopeptidase family protein [Xanthomonadales bacterium]|nr:peptidoglycan DD-metalloendopeptidase family protein [Xanthomonadales bacterium]